MKKSILLANIGTPDDTSLKAVRGYLKEFLSDPRVIDLPFFMRWLLVNIFILPFRSKKTARAYQKIWLPQGSPLLMHSQHLRAKLAEALGEGYKVEIGMRYGHPSLQEALAKLLPCDELIILPLFPQYSSAATGSAIAEVMQQLTQQWNIPSIRFIHDFYAQAGFISAYAQVIQPYWQQAKGDLLLFSYHGLPERHINKSLCDAACDRVAGCPVVDERNRFCYRAQCYATSALIAKELGLSSEKYHVSFQSRLGRTPWIKPYTDLLLPEFIQRGIKNIAVVCPSFTADCLETLEEVNIRAREQWRQLGGGEFVFIPSLNAHPAWVEALVSLVVNLNKSKC